MYFDSRTAFIEGEHGCLSGLPKCVELKQSYIIYKLCKTIVHFDIY
jgi:hypothetical protein